MEFHIGVSSADPQGVDVAGLRRQLEELGGETPSRLWRLGTPINDLGQWYEKPAELAALTANPEGYFAATRDLVATRQDGIYYLLLRDDAGKGVDRFRRRLAIGPSQRRSGPSGSTIHQFALDQSGALRMGQLTGANKGRNMAIVLDSEVFRSDHSKSDSETVKSPGTSVPKKLPTARFWCRIVVRAVVFRAHLGKRPWTIDRCRQLGTRYRGLLVCVGCGGHLHGSLVLPSGTDCRPCPFGQRLGHFRGADGRRCDLHLAWFGRNCPYRGYGGGCERSDL